MLRRGWAKRCPRCGEGRLFRRFIAFHERCPSCGLQYQRNNGDTWLFMIVTDRIPMLLAIAIMYFGFVTSTWVGTTVFIIAAATPILATIRERQGLALALDYLSRIYFRDESDDIHASEQYVR